MRRAPPFAACAALLALSGVGASHAFAQELEAAEGATRAREDAGRGLDASIAALREATDAARGIAAERDALVREREAATARLAELLAASGEAQRRLTEAQAEPGRLQAEMEAILEELREGHYCSQCNRSRTEIQAGGEDFYAHLARVNGQEIPAPQSAIDAKTREYTEKILHARDAIPPAQAAVVQAQQSVASGEAAVAAVRTRIDDAESRLARARGQISTRSYDVYRNLTRWMRLVVVEYRQWDIYYALPEAQVLAQIEDLEAPAVLWRETLDQWGVRVALVNRLRERIASLHDARAARLASFGDAMREALERYRAALSDLNVVVSEQFGYWPDMVSPNVARGHALNRPPANLPRPFARNDRDIESYRRMFDRRISRWVGIGGLWFAPEVHVGNAGVTVDERYTW